jgi:drug/metabolite transporter (DMT)-like permease
LAVAFVPSNGVTARALLVGGLGGISGAVGLMCLYHGLAIGTMSVVSPVTAVVSAAVPVGAGLLAGEQLSGMGFGGVMLGLVAIVLVSLNGGTGGASAGRSVLFALAAGAGFGFFFVALARTGTRPGLWPLVAARPASILLAAIVAARQGAPMLVPGGQRLLASSAGVLDMLANVLFLYASQRGTLAIIAVISALYPASTVALARWVDRERLNRLQVVGLIAALIAVGTMSAAGS